MSVENCKHGNSAPVRILSSLPENQAIFGRHRCTVCAYAKAKEKHARPSSKGALRRCPHGNYAPVQLINSLPKSQGGSGRHKCAVCAYARVHPVRKKKTVEASAKPARCVPNTLTEVTTNNLRRRKTAARQSNRKTISPLDSERAAEIGKAGELLVLESERERLQSAGLKSLSQKVSHVAVTKGDSAGYDIHSYTNEGEDKFIEVKTTTGSAVMPFFLTPNELRFSERNTQKYYLVRVYQLDEQSNSASCFVVQGDLREFFDLNPTEYRAKLRAND